MNPLEYVQSEKHLPEPLRDFHDQKDVFKRIWRMVEMRRKTDPQALDAMHWINGHVFVIDFFLWFMAQHGWTLQRSRARGVHFYDLAFAIKTMRDEDTEAFRKMLDERKSAETKP